MVIYIFSKTNLILTLIMCLLLKSSVWAMMHYS